MKVLILGGEGYLGFSLAQYLRARDCSVIGIDDFSRRALVKRFGGKPLTGNSPIVRKKDVFDEFYHGNYRLHIQGLLSRHEDLDAIVHFAEQPSAPFSMGSKEDAVETINNNVINTMYLLWAMRDFSPNAHLVKLGTMGEYGTPPIPIPEGFLSLEPWGLADERLPFPKQPGSIYHASKVMDSVLVEMLCRLWGFRSTDIMQGVVYGVALDENKDSSDLWTRFDYDAVFGTALNRFVAQSLIEHPLTVYGKGGQTRGFLDIRDSMECIWLALSNPPKEGEYRVFNQFAYTHSISRLANIVKSTAKEFGLNVRIKRIHNPRLEAEEHFYQVATDNLRNLGYSPRKLSNGVRFLFERLIEFKQKVNPEAILPRINWRRDADVQETELVREKKVQSLR
jgi:UDP-sulfoquinovose synthase